MAGKSPPYSRTGVCGRLFLIHFLLVAAGRNVAPIWNHIIDFLSTGFAITQRQLAVGNFTAGAVLFYVFPVAKCVFVFDLHRLFTGQRDRPMCGIHSGQHDTAGIPLRQAAIETIEEACNVDGPSGCIGRCGDSHA